MTAPLVGTLDMGWRAWAGHLMPRSAHMICPRARGSARGHVQSIKESASGTAPITCPPDHSSTRGRIEASRRSRRRPVDRRSVSHRHNHGHQFRGRLLVALAPAPKRQHREGSSPPRLETGSRPPDGPAYFPEQASPSPEKPRAALRVQLQKRKGNQRPAMEAAAVPSQ